MNKIKIGILDLNAGNIFSVYKVFRQITKNVEIIEDYNNSKSFTHLVVPGVASFGSAMKNLKEKKFDIILNDFIVRKKPLLGLCVGCQILFKESNEFGFHEGLNLTKTIKFYSISPNCVKKSRLSKKSCSCLIFPFSIRISVVP